MTRIEWCKNTELIHYHPYCLQWPDDPVDDETGAFLLNYEELPEVSQADRAADEEAQNKTGEGDWFDRPEED